MKVVKVVKETKEYKVIEKRSGRFGVLKPGTRTWVNGEEKQAILLKEGLIKISEAAPVEEAPAEEVVEESAE